MRARVDRKVDALAENPRPAGAKKLKGSSELWRVRAGDYRVIYSIHDDVLLILVVKIGHRGDVYR
jgi:mRNA interferase RelE/StbE